MPELSTAQCKCYDVQYLAYHVLLAPELKDALKTRVLDKIMDAEEDRYGCFDPTQNPRQSSNEGYC